MGKKEFNLDNEVKQLKAIVHEIERESIIVNIQGWRMRLYGDYLNIGVGREISVNYTGDLEDIHSIKLIDLA